MTLAYLPSPDTGVWEIGPFPLRAYALAIITGVVAAVLIGERRWVARGGTRGVVTDVATIAVPFGILGARVYHVITSPGPYLDDPVSALYVWKGGLGIPGGIAGGFLAAYVLCRRRGISKSAFADSVAPGIAVAQAIGRLGNWFNQELFGRPTTLPWGLEIDPDNPDAVAGAQAYHPTFLYELLWNLGVAGLVVWADRRWRLGGGRVFALYVGAYAVGRIWIEELRIDDANELFGLRLNDYVMAVVLVGAVVYLRLRRGVGREDRVEPAQEPDTGQHEHVPDPDPSTTPERTA
ncbi:MAG: prolipoprotein diacylglyceryl transferase [Frankiales bacterium]|jgi:prolipoprotein diacylglyceryl transferase|nr:prolipoprotein diacylglyceryl transferase [Frankiales bacterium]